jgi:hypothetical protein
MAARSHWRLSVLLRKLWTDAHVLCERSVGIWPKESQACRSAVPRYGHPSNTRPRACAGANRTLRVDPSWRVGFEVPEAGDDLEAVVDGIATTSALPQYLPVFEAGDEVFDAGPDPAVRPVVVIADDPAGVVASGGVVMVLMPR